MVDREAMKAELLAIWKRCKPQCDKRAGYFNGYVGGLMHYVPHAAGVEAMAVVRKYFTEALERLAVSSAA
jgi:hypothetical protein